jgi:four helix bundle protein
MSSEFFNQIIAEQKIEYENVIKVKSYNFAVRIVKFYKIQNCKANSLNPILKQLLRSGTSIGSNVSEAQSASSRKDFINKLTIAQKESRESLYWINLLYDSDEISKREYDSLFNDSEELVKLLSSILKSLNNS